ncbi:MAG: hypothetical protein ABSE82_15870 [Nitrososphaerales archaeon]|jgi:hypothetical protein
MKNNSDEAALQLFELCRSEREMMTQSAKRIIALLDGERTEGVTFDKEFTEFLGHLSNIKGFLSKRDQKLSELTVELIQIYRRFGASDQIKVYLYELLTFPVDYSNKPFKKIRAAVNAMGIGAAIGLER